MSNIHGTREELVAMIVDQGQEIAITRERDERLEAEIERLRAALEACRQYVRHHHHASSWWNDQNAWNVIKDHIDPALGTRTE